MVLSTLTQRHSDRNPNQHSTLQVSQTKTDLRDLDTGASAFRDATVAREGSLDELLREPTAVVEDRRLAAIRAANPSPKEL